MKLQSTALTPEGTTSPALQATPKAPLRVCTVAYTFYESDGRVMRYNEALASRGDTVDVLALRKSDRPRNFDYKGVRITGVQTREGNERSPFAYMIRILLFFLRVMFVLTWRQLRV